MGQHDLEETPEDALRRIAGEAMALHSKLTQTERELHDMTLLVAAIVFQEGENRNELLVTAESLIGAPGQQSLRIQQDLPKYGVRLTLEEVKQGERNQHRPSDAQLRDGTPPPVSGREVSEPSRPLLEG